MPELFGYQNEGRDFLASRQVALLADDPGVGKTPQALRAARRRFGPVALPAFKVCIVTTKASIENWRREAARWWPDGRDDCPEFFIINYDVLSLTTHPSRSHFNLTPWDLIIADEAHRLKSPGAKRAQTFYRKAVRAKKEGATIWLLTGTPAKNHPGELFTHLRSLRPDLIMARGGKPMNQFQFENRYCDVKETPYGRRISGGDRRRLKELRGKLDGFMLRRRKHEVLKDLPPLILDTFPLSIDSATTKRIPTIPGIDASMSEDAILNVLKQEHQSTERRLLGMVKAPYVADFVESELDAPGKIIVFCHHREVMTEIEDMLGQFKPARIDGRTKDPQGQADMFNNDPKCRVFIGQITACGEAINLTAANQVVFAEASWSPSDNYQAACRAHRIGMQSGLLVRFMHIPRSVDEIIQKVLARKASDLAEIFD